MTDKIVSLQPNPINHEAIEMVERLLESLRTGEIMAVGIVGVRNAGEVETAYSHVAQFHQLNSGIAVLAHRLLMANWKA